MYLLPAGDCPGAASGERDWLINTPGHVFGGGESGLLIILLTLITSFGWTAYLYFDHGLIFLSWEGDFLDVWSPDSNRYHEIGERMKTLGVPISKDSPPA